MKTPVCISVQVSTILRRSCRRLRMLGARQDSFEVARIVAAAAAVVGAVFCGSFAEEARYLDAQIQMRFAMAKY